MKKIKQIPKKDLLKIIVLVIILTLIVGTTIYAVTNKNKKTVETGGEIIDNQEFEATEEIDNNINEISEETNEISEETNEITNEINEEKDKKGDTNKKENEKNQNKYYVKVNNSANVVTIYTYDDNGNYTKPVKAMVCSTGTATPKSGKYKLNGTKHRWHTLFGNVYGQYTTAIVGNILFHSVPYTVKGDPSSLEYWEYDKLGTRASAGCVRLTVADAQWIYNNIGTGTTVEFYSDSNPGPLGKPSAQKISSNAECRGWDPTDSNSKNPWRNGSGNSTQNTQNVQEQPAKTETPKTEQPTSTEPESKPEQPKQEPTQPTTPTQPTQPTTPTQPENNNTPTDNNTGTKNDTENTTENKKTENTTENKKTENTTNNTKESTINKTN